MLHITFCRQHCAVFFHNVTSLDQPWQLLLVVPLQLPQSSSSVKTTVHVSPLRARPWMRLFCQSVDHMVFEEEVEITSSMIWTLFLSEAQNSSTVCS